MKKTYHGSCHCGAVRFECALDLGPPGARSPSSRTGRWWTSTFKCNCTICTKTKFWKAFVPASEFRLSQGASALTDYQFGARIIHHLFCSRCGVRAFARAHLDEMGGEFYAVNLNCLDDVTAEELIAAPITYEDGRNDDWYATPAETRHL